MLYHDSGLARRAKLIAALEKVAQGDQTSLREVYSLTSSKLFGICLRICRDREAAADVLQEVYIKVWHRAGRFDPAKASPITWLGTIARNTAIDFVRSQQARDGKVAMTTWSEEPTLILFEDRSAFETLEGAQTRWRLEKCLDKLGENQGGAIRSAFFDGLTYTELADSLALPLGTIKSWVRRGLLHLRDCLGDAR